MLNRINSIVFYLSFSLFLLNIIIYFMGFIQVIAAMNNAFVIFGFIGLTLGLKLTRNSPNKLKFGIVGLIFTGSLIWIISFYFKIIDFAIYWKYALLLIFIGIIWAIWNKVFFKGNKILKIIFALSSLMLVFCTVLTCFSFLDDSNFLFISLLVFTSSAVLIILLNERNKKKHNSLREVNS